MAAITAEQVKRRLGGLQVYLDQLDPADRDGLLQEAIDAAEAWWERETRVLLSSKLIRTNPQDGEEYDIADAPYSLHRSFSTRPIRIQLRFRPVQEILSVRLEFNRESTIIDLPLSWVRYDPRMGIVTIVPYGAAAPVAAAAGATMWLPVLSRAVWPGEVIPQFIAVDYRAGYSDAANDPELADVRDCLARDAAWRVLSALRSLVPTSVGVDGFNQAFDTVQQRIEELQREVQQFVDLFKRRQRPLVVGVL